MKDLPSFSSAEERDQYLSDHRSDFQASPETVEQVLQPFREGKEDKAQISLEPIIFRTKAKTPPSVPYLKVFATTSLDTSPEVNHLLHSKIRSHAS